jgi:hypothetical protein
MLYIHKKVMKWTRTKTAIVVACMLVGAVLALVLALHFRTRDSVFTSRKEVSDSGNATFKELTGATPAEVAKTFLDACSHDDWTEATKYWPADFLEKNPKFLSGFTNHYGGIEIISMGKPFKGRIAMFKGMEYPGVYVPYEIRLKDGTIRKWQLAIRCDNPEKHWYWDGGM